MDRARRMGRMLGTAAAAAVMVIALMLGLSGPLALPNATAHVVGSGPALTPDEQVPAGWYEATWAARTASPSARGCLFGLRLEQRGTDDAESGIGRGAFPGKLAFRTVPGGATISGSSGPRHLAAGLYGFVVDGSCAWEVTLAPAEPPPLPSGATYGGPRM